MSAPDYSNLRLTTDDRHSIGVATGTTGNCHQTLRGSGRVASSWERSGVSGSPPREGRWFPKRSRRNPHSRVVVRGMRITSNWRPTLGRPNEEPDQPVPRPTKDSPCPRGTNKQEFKRDKHRFTKIPKCACPKNPSCIHRLRARHPPCTCQLPLPA